MKIALVSTGLGRVLRGFESFTESLFHALREYSHESDVTLFQGGGNGGHHRRVVPNFHRDDLPARWMGEEKGNLLEKRSFALALYPLLLAGKYEIVHYNELAMGSALFHLRKILGGGFKLLYCNGAPSPAIHFHHRCDYAQMLHGFMYEEARAFGIDADKLFMLPYGVNSDQYSPRMRTFRDGIRRKLDIPFDAKVILTTAALNCWHKRIDYLIQETARLTEDFWLVAAGQRTSETQPLIAKAKELIPGRCRIVSWPQEETNLLYGAADIFTLASLHEGFGLVTLEAMASGLPVIIHHGPVFRWLAGESNVICIDMAREGELALAVKEASRIQYVSNARDNVVKRFSWKSLLPKYLRMYKKIAECRIAA